VAASPNNCDKLRLKSGLLLGRPVSDFTEVAGGLRQLVDV